MSETQSEIKIEELEAQYETEFEVGQDNVQMLGMDLHNPVFFFSSLLILVFVIGTLLFPESANTALGDTKTWAINNFDWLFMVAGNFFVLFCLTLVVLPFGRIRLGGDDARPEFSTLSWFAMLFAAGMGIGLMFWSVAEPVAYYTDWYGTPLGVEANTEAGAHMAMGATMFHWGLHPWAIYAVVALSLAFFAYNKDMPLTIRSAFYPLLGDRVWGWPGHIIDTVAVVATIFGLATSLGFGAKQAGGGLEFLFDIPNQINTQIAIIIGVTAVAIFSVVRGLDGGVKLLSNINMGIAAVLLLFVVLAGSTVAILGWMGTTLVSYVENIFSLSNWVGRDDETWYHGWTVFYWAWWISWSPFVGMFIARVSRGRTVREFIIAVLLIPTLITVVWMGAFGGSAVEQAMNGVGALTEGIDDVSLAMFQMLENLPLTNITSFLGIVLVLVFFVTSSDSGSLVIDSITAGGKLDAPVPQRIFWATMEGVIAGALLFGGGEQALGALQAGAISVGLPFTVVLLLMCVSLFKALNHEHLLLRLKAA
ncbi:MAG: BCCT family transporter [Alcanivoracaceae bacterium]|nr:BCCT family transporter [Alcanivoracaceae bacterium]